MGVQLELLGDPTSDMNPGGVVIQLFRVSLHRNSATRQNALKRASTCSGKIELLRFDIVIFNYSICSV